MTMTDGNPPPAILSRLFGLDGQVAAVVGGAGRIGRAVCHAIAEAGAKLAIVDVNGPAAQELAAEIAGHERQTVIAIQADASRPDDLERAVAAIGARIGPPAMLVNCAQFRGTGFYSSQVEHYSLDAWEQVLRVNLTAVQLACQAFGRSMIAHGGGRIVNVSSTYGVVSPDPRIYGASGVNSPVAYAASKAGVINLTRYLAVHWREQNIRVNCLVPGGVFDNQSPDFVTQYSARTPLGRMAKPDDYQGAILFMLSAASAYMTGAVVTVDGGWTAW